jgi:hypothetical protein
MSGPLAKPSDRSFRQLTATNDGNPNVASTGPCVLLGIQITNVKAAFIFLKLYDYTGSAPVAGDTPRKTLAIPASSTKEYNFGPNGIQFAKGLAYRVTAAAADADATALLANDFSCLNLDLA